MNKRDSKKFEKLPAHKLTVDIRANFWTNTSLYVFGNFELDQIQYAMKSIPDEEDDFSSGYFYPQRLHNQLKIDVKLSQKMYKHYEVYFMCQNILDDYDADPFNPGPGRSVYGGLKISF